MSCSKVRQRCSGIYRPSHFVSDNLGHLRLSASGLKVQHIFAQLANDLDKLR